jgi:hypothetical protein
MPFTIDAFHLAREQFVEPVGLGVGFGDPALEVGRTHRVDIEISRYWKWRPLNWVFSLRNVPVRSACRFSQVYIPAIA